MRSRRKFLGLISSAIFATGAVLAAPAPAQAPQRVMSLNLCTDQLAMALAAPGQLASVSFLAREPALSLMHEEAKRYPVNSGLAEEVFLQKPDLVVTGTYSLHNTTELLKKLDFEVAEFSFAQTLDTIPAEVRRMGKLLGRKEAGEAVASAFEAELAELTAQQCAPRPTAVVYDQNGIASGTGTLAHSVLEAAGFENLAAKRGLAGMAPFPLELLVAARPDVIITGGNGTAPTLGAYVPRHPAIGSLPQTRIGAFVPPGSWSCANPGILKAVRALVELRRKIAPCPGKEAPAEAAQ